MKKKTKIALIENIPTPYGIPLYREVSKDESFDFTFIFFSLSEVGRNWDSDILKDINYKVLGSKPINLGSGKVWDNKLVYLDLKVRDVLKEKAFDAVIMRGWSDLTSYYTYFYCRKNSIPYILWSGSIASRVPKRYWLFRRVSRLISGFLIRNADALIAYGTLSREYLLSRGAKSDRVFIAWNCMDTNKFKEEVIKLKQYKEKIKGDLKITQKIAILYAGRLIERKGVYYLIEAFKNVKNIYPDTTLLLVGSGELESGLKRYVDENNIPDVLFQGHVDYKELPKIYAIADLFVFPTLEDIWGLVLNEALSAGLPIVTTSAAGASKDLVDGNGIIVPPADSKALYEAIAKMLRFQENMRTMGQRSLDLISKFTIENAAKGCIEAIEFACQNRRKVA